MAVVKGQAIRRREGQLPNTAVMAEHGSVEPPVPESPRCPVRSCRAPFSPGGATYFGVPVDVDQHVAMEHPRSRHADEARNRIHNRRMDDVSDALSRY